MKFSLIQKFQKLETNWLAKGGYEVIGKLGGRPRTSIGGRWWKFETWAQTWESVTFNILEHFSKDSFLMRINNDG